MILNPMFSGQPARIKVGTYLEPADYQYYIPKHKNNNNCIEVNVNRRIKQSEEMIHVINNAEGLIRRLNANVDTSGVYTSIPGEETIHVLERSLLENIHHRTPWTPLVGYAWVEKKAKHINFPDYAPVFEQPITNNLHDLLVNNLAFVDQLPIYFNNRPTTTISYHSFSKFLDLAQCNSDFLDSDYFTDDGDVWTDLNGEDTEKANWQREEYNSIIADASIDLMNGLFVDAYNRIEYFVIYTDGEMKTVDQGRMLELGARYYEAASFYYIPPDIKLLATINTIGNMHVTIALNIQGKEDLVLLFPKAIIASGDTMDVAKVKEMAPNHEGLVFWYYPEEGTCTYFNVNPFGCSYDDIEKIWNESLDYGNWAQEQIKQSAEDKA